VPKPEIQQAAIALASACLCALQIYVFHWGVITPDTVVQYGQALTGVYDDWHPPVTAWLWRQLLIFHRGSAPFLILDSLLYWGGFAAIAELLRRRRSSKAAWLVILLAALPIGFGQIGAILKDSLMAALLVVAAALILWREQTVGRVRLWLAITALPFIVIASATRFNAAFAAAPLLLLLVPRPWLRSSLRVGLVLGGVALLLAATGWLINGVALRPHRSSPIFSLVNFDLAGIVAHGGGNDYPSLSAADAARFTAHCYEPRQYGARDNAGCTRPEDSLADYANRRHVGAIGIWLGAVAHAPLPYIAHRLGHLNWNWRFLVTEIPNDAVFVMSQPNDLGLHFTKTHLASAFGIAGKVMAWSPLGRPASWLCIAIGLLIVAPTLPSRNYINAMAASALLYGCAYAAVSVAPDLRYNFWTMIAVMIGLAVALADGRGALAVIGRRRLTYAIAPLVAASVLEMGALTVGLFST
jgi:hypothetical protein